MSDRVHNELVLFKQSSVPLLALAFCLLYFNPFILVSNISHQYLCVYVCVFNVH